jgi:transcription elongation factor GreA
VCVDSVGSPDIEFTIVGDDEADVKAGKIGITSPLAAALLGKRAGGRAVWHRPVGDRQLRIRTVSYD